MGTSYQNAVEYVKDQMQQGKITADEANVKLIQMTTYRIISGKLPAQVRKVLNAAVKAGELGHIKSDGLKPEVYYNGNLSAKTKALEARERVFRDAIERMKNVFG